MRDARLEYDWRRTSHIMAIIHNVNCTDNPVDGNHYNPYREEHE